MSAHFPFHTMTADHERRSSFAELLRHEGLTPFAGMSAGVGASLATSGHDLTHGTTIVALRHSTP